MPGAVKNCVILANKYDFVLLTYFFTKCYKFTIDVCLILQLMCLSHELGVLGNEKHT